MKLSSHPLYPNVKMDNQEYLVKVQKVEPAIRLFPVVGGIVGQIPLNWGTKAFENSIKQGQIAPIENKTN